MGNDRSRVVSSFTLIKGSLIGESYTVFHDWDFSISRRENFRRVRENNTIGATSVHWARDVAKVLNRRFEPSGRDRPLVDLARGNCDLEIWKPLLLWHMTRDEFLVRDFLVNWLYPRWTEGAIQLRSADLVPYLKSLARNRGVLLSGQWSDVTTARVASGLLRLAVDFGFLMGKAARQFTSYHMPDSSFIYLLHAMVDQGMSARGIIESDDWHMYLMNSADVERELLRLHQFHKVQYEVAGSLVKLELPERSTGAYAKEIVA